MGNETNGFHTKLEKFIDVVSDFPAACFDWNLETDECRHSFRLRRILGYMNDEPMPQAWFQHFDDSISFEAMKQLNDFIRYGRDDEYTEVKPFKTKQGHVKTLMVKATVFRDEQKQPVRIVGSVIDLLWFKLLEK